MHVSDQILNHSVDSSYSRRSRISSNLDIRKRNIITLSHFPRVLVRHAARKAPTSQLTLHTILINTAFLHIFGGVSAATSRTQYPGLAFIGDCDFTNFGFSWVWECGVVTALWWRRSYIVCSYYTIHSIVFYLLVQSLHTGGDSAYIACFFTSSTSCCNHFCKSCYLWWLLCKIYHHYVLLRLMVTISTIVWVCDNSYPNWIHDLWLDTRRRTHGVWGSGIVCRLLSSFKQPAPSDCTVLYCTVMSRVDNVDNVDNHDHRFHRKWGVWMWCQAREQAGYQRYGAQWKWSMRKGFFAYNYRSGGVSMRFGFW